MREIKFKFWLKDDESMVDWFDAIDSVGGIEYFMLSDEVDRLQFTGLTDTNGVEIYESDIAQCDRGLLWVIKFINGCFMACNPVDENDYCMIDDYPLAVVGNIHQNPELLEQS